jgi:DMSO/TMAO reductase YedYZ heme-binding membrane subunit
MSTGFVWYVARAGGLVSYVLLATTVVWGTALAARAFRARPGLPWLSAMHEWLGVLALTFLGVHIGALLLDTYMRFTVVDVLVPFASKWHPGAVAWGVIGLYLMLAVQLSARFRGKLPKRYRPLWKKVHLASYPLFGVATIHLLTAGTDSRTFAASLAVAAAVAAVLVAIGKFRRGAVLAWVAPTRP